MGIMRKTLMLRFRAIFHIPVFETYGYITKCLRETHGIRKSHAADARCIAGAPTAKPCAEAYLVVPVRRHNRQIHKAAILKGGVRKKNQAQKSIFGFKLFDYVKSVTGDYGFVFGRRSSGSFDIRCLSGAKISACISCKKLSLLQHPRGLLFEKYFIEGESASSQWLKPGVSAL